MRPLDALSSATRLAASVALITVAASCGGDSKSSTEPDPQTGDPASEFVAGISTADLQTVATFRTDSRPAEGSGPTVDAVTSAAAILGGSSQVALQSATAFSRVIIAVEAASGYYELSLPSAATSAELVLTLPQELRDSAFTLLYAIAAATGSVGAYDEVPVAVRTVGTGDVQVSISWDALSDVDLHVVDPSGEDIYYGNQTAASGGELDLDSNAECRIDRVNNENITFPAGQAPRGTYIVRVDYWSSCEVPQTKYVLTIRVAGLAPQTFSGTLTGAGDEGGEGSGETIATFTY